MLAIYRRVSTEDQNTEAQGREIDRYIEVYHPGAEYKVYEDHALSGARKDRPALLAMLADCEAGLVTEVVVYKLDRLTRGGAGEAVKIIHLLDGLDINFTSVSEPHYSHDNPMRMTMVAMMGDVARLERNNLRDRVNAGIAAAKDRGVKFGAPPKYTDEDVEILSRLRAQGYSYRDIQEITGISKSTAQRLLTKAA